VVCWLVADGVDGQVVIKFNFLLRAHTQVIDMYLVINRSPTCPTYSFKKDNKTIVITKGLGCPSCWSYLSGLYENTARAFEISS
jgi:hypothetical protein